jgi:hypothetical protein
MLKVVFDFGMLDNPILLVRSIDQHSVTSTSFLVSPSDLTTAASTDEKGTIVAQAYGGGPSIPRDVFKESLLLVGSCSSFWLVFMSVFFLSESQDIADHLQY